MENNITVTGDYDKLCQFHDLLCDLLSHINRDPERDPEYSDQDILLRIESDKEYIEYAQQRIHEAMEQADRNGK